MVIGLRVAVLGDHLTYFCIRGLVLERPEGVRVLLEPRDLVVDVDDGDEDLSAGGARDGALVFGDHVELELGQVLVVEDHVGRDAARVLVNRH